MKEKNTGEVTVKRKKLIYSIVLSVSLLLLIAATVLTVYFVTKRNRTVLENPPVGDNPDPNTPSGGENPDPNPPSGGENPDPNPPSGGENPDPNTPSGGEDAVKFVSPVEAATCSVEFKEIYYNETLNQIQRHMAVDFSAEAGTKVVSVAAGTVKEISYSKETGNRIIIDHGDNLLSYYYFVEPVVALKEGDKVVKGQEIAAVAESYGREGHQEAHLHFALQLGKEWMDPAEYFDITYEEK